MCVCVCVWGGGVGIGGLIGIKRLIIKNIYIKTLRENKRWGGGWGNLCYWSYHIMAM